MSGHIDRAAEVLATEIHEAWEFQYDECDHGEYRGGHLHGERYAMCRLTAERIIRRRAAAGLLATPAHDAAVAAKALRDTAKRIRSVVENPRWESERFTEHVLIDAGVERLLNDYADLIGPIEREGGGS